MKTTKKNLFKFLLALSALSLVETSFAGDLCAPGSLSDFTTDNVTFREDPSDACAILPDGSNPGSGNSSKSGITDNLLLADTEWALFLKDEDNEDTLTANLSDLGGAFASWNVEFTLNDVTTGGQSGSWELVWSDNGTNTLPLELDLLVALKASNTAGAFLFENEVFLDTPDTGSGSWTIQFENNGDQNPELSNFTIYVANPSTPGGGGGTGNVPVPAPFALIVAGLIAITQTRRRTK